MALRFLHGNNRILEQTESGKNMDEWKKKFEKSTLERGKASYLNHRVADVKEIKGGYKAAVLGRQRFEVTIKTDGETLGRVSCICPVARGGGKCEHMAAVLYAIETKKRAKKEGVDEAALMEQQRQSDLQAHQQEERLLEEKQRKKREREEAKKRSAEKAAEDARRKEEERAAEEKRRKEAEKAAEEARQKAAEKAADEARQEKEREERRLARKKRKEEKERQREEQKRKAEEARRKESERLLAEEARRKEIREQKVAEAKRRAQKRQKEQEEAIRRAAEREQEEARRLLEEKQEMARRKEEQRQKEEARRPLEEMEREEEARRLAKRKRQKDARVEEESMRKENQLQDFEQRKSEFTLLGNPWEEDLEGQGAQGGSEGIQKLEQYSYFNGAQIRNSMEISKRTFTEGQKLIAQGKIRLKQVVSGYEQYSREIMGQIDAVGSTDREEFPVRILFSQKEVTHAECRCPKCRRDYYAWYSKKTSCAYKAGGLQLLEDFLNTHNIGDATDEDGRVLLDSFKKKRANMVIADAAAKEESLRLVPRLAKKGGKLTVSFKVGERKLFVIKKLDEFCENVRTSATGTYGTSTQINHSLSNFTEQGKGWIRFINRIVREEEEFQQRMMESRSYYTYKKSGIGGELNLFGWRLDEFYGQLGGDEVEYEDKDNWEKKKETLSCAKRNPKVAMRISEEDSEDRVFHGVKVEGSLPDLYLGTDTAYYIGNGHINQVEKDFLDKIEPLSLLAGQDRFSFHVGRNHMAEFYYQILPQLQDVVDIKETNPEKFRSYLPPEVHFVFYLDAEEQNATCRVFACYGDKEYSALDVMRNSSGKSIELFRNTSAEEEVLFHVTQLFPEIDWKKEELSCGGKEELVYEVMQHGTDRLLELGEVRCTKHFLGLHNIRSMKVSVGVSVSSGLLELDITTEDVPRDELLDILNGYRTKKKYFRLKDGSFVNLEDSSLEMLAELMETAHVKPKEFVKGKMHLPMYRTLYLDKMLEENESVYSNRDSHFRDVVKGFKTVKDADFEEPKSLSKIMRKYQKNGYKWLRTLEAWQFGGILADDMGLGKTLQVIAVLLAAKQEGRSETSLVVAPASLLFNWGEEFERFAPELAISLITGTQEERRKKIEDYKTADVLVTSYDLLKRDIVHYEDKEFTYEIIDEAQYIKNHTTAAAKAVKIIKSRFRYALTGTPIENRLSELWSIFDYLMPGFLYGYDVFKKEMESPIVKSSDEKAMARLQKMVSPFILRRLKEDVLKDLPEKLEECRYVRFGETQQKLYDAQVLHMREEIARQNPDEFNKNKMRILAELMRLRQICCDPSLCFENYRGEAAKLEACLQLVQSAIDGGHRMLVFSQFTSMLEILQQKLDAEGIGYYTITGSTPKKKRLDLVKEFNEGDVKVFLISLKAGGVGLNLTGADVVIHYDPWWNQAVQNQATDRAHRIGQTRKVTVYKLIAKHTIEEKIQKLQETKKNLADQIVGGEAGQLGSLSREEIMELLEV